MRKILLIFAVGVVAGALLPRDRKRRTQPNVDEEQTARIEVDKEYVGTER